jgi:hypothetical protein
MQFFSQLFASAIGGAVAGYFVVVGVKLQFRRQGEAALRALMVEVVANKEASLDMTQGRSYSPGEYERGHPDPGWLKHSIWDSQLPFVVQILDEGTLVMVRYAYSLLDSVPAMAIGSDPAYASRFARGGWIDDQLNKIQTAFSDADRALEKLRERLGREADSTWYNRLQKSAAGFLGKSADVV